LAVGQGDYSQSGIDQPDKEAHLLGHRVSAQAIKRFDQKKRSGRYFSGLNGSKKERQGAFAAVFAGEPADPEITQTQDVSKLSPCSSA
jgi:hypothetical protein